SAAAQHQYGTRDRCQHLPQAEIFRVFAVRDEIHNCGISLQPEASATRPQRFVRQPRDSLGCDQGMDAAEPTSVFMSGTVYLEAIPHVISGNVAGCGAELRSGVG